MDLNNERPVVNVDVNPNPNAAVNVVNANPNPNAAVNVDSSVMRNLLILQEIFGYLTIDQVKDARTVCKIWETVGTSCLSRRCSLSTNKFYESCPNGNIGSRFSPTIKAQLVRSVGIVQPETKKGDKKIDLGFVAFVRKYREHIEEIIFRVDRHFAQTIKRVLETVIFVNLKTIELHEYCHPIKRIAGAGLLDAFDNLNFLPTITMLKISAPENMKGRDGGNRVDEQDGYPYYQIVQQIINRSPNLEKLFIQENFYPDLSRCRKLKVLDYKGYPFKPFRSSENDDDEDDEVDLDEQEIQIREDFSLSKMFKMLNQVQDTLEELVIGTAGEYTMDELEIPVLPDSTNIKVPSFPCLKSLSIYPIDVYLFGFENVKENQLPRLQKLTLRVLDDERGYLSETLLTMKPWTNVQSLSLTTLQHQRDDQSIIKKIVQIFPNTTKFHLWIKGDLRNDSTPKNFQRFKDDLMEIGTANWNIQHLEIGIEFNITLSQLMDALGEVTMDCFKQLKTLKLTSTDIYDGGCDNFEKPFMTLRNITFDQIKFKRRTLIKMIKFTERNDLNIHFLNVD